MVSETINQTEIETENYCSDCLYHWCKQRAKVLFCTMKSKGLFECRSCLLKLLGNQSELLEVEMNHIHDLKVMTETP